MELAHAFELAGACTQKLHINELIANPQVIADFDLIGFPGGFSYGDDIAAGRILANRLRHKLMDQLLAAADRGVPMIGICNGFQVMTKLGLLPDPHAGKQTATLADNNSGRFTCKWVKMTVPANTCCVWTKGLSELELPIAHAEGRFVPESAEALARWEEKGQIAIKYATDDNPNGSTADIAGVCDESGLILGLMPHPERWVHITNHPHWQRKGDDFKAQTPAGLKIFQNVVEHVTSSASATA
jgi:phosphoribosylformylglycinamidine synthase